MHADEQFRPVGRCRQPGNRNRRRIGGDERAGLQPRTQIREDLALDAFIFRGRLDNEIAVGQLIDAWRRFDPLHAAVMAASSMIPFDTCRCKFFSI